MKFFKVLYFLIILIFLVMLGVGIWYFLYVPNQPGYTAEDFQIARLVSKTDYDHDGIDDYTDILEGAKKEAQNKPYYKSAYYQRRISTR